MTWTKQELVEQALEELGYASYTFDVQPELMESAHRRMDAMVSEWDAVGVRISYQRNGDVSEPSGIPDHAATAVYLGLAVMLAPSLGKLVGPDLGRAARGAYQKLLARAVMPEPAVLRGGFPLGAGNLSSGFGSTPVDNPLAYLDT